MHSFESLAAGPAATDRRHKYLGGLAAGGRRPGWQARGQGPGKSIAGCDREPVASRSFTPAHRLSTSTAPDNASVTMLAMMIGQLPSMTPKASHIATRRAGPLDFLSLQQSQPVDAEGEVQSRRRYPVEPLDGGRAGKFRRK